MSTTLFPKFFPLDQNEQIPMTEFRVGFVIDQLDASDQCKEWHRLREKSKGHQTLIKIENISGKGYLSTVHRLTFANFDGQEEENDDEFRVILKVPTVEVLQKIRPLDSPEKIAYLTQTISAFHRREVAFYGQIVLKYLQNIDGLSYLIPRAWAWEECGQGHQQKEEDSKPKLGRAFLLMEDVSAGKDHRHIEGQIESVIQAMARLHAHSLAIPSELLKTHFWPEKTFQYDQIRLHQQLCSLPDPTGAYFRAHTLALTKFIERTESGQEIDAKIAEQFGMESPVLCHGDLWTKNMLFDENEVRGIFDWQCVHLGSGLSDICHFMLVGVDPEMRRQMTDHWLGLYHSCFVKSLSALQNRPKTPLSNLETVKAIYRTQFPIHLHFLMCLEAFFANKPDEEEKREKMRQRLVQAFDEDIRLDFE